MDPQSRFSGQNEQIHKYTRYEMGSGLSEGIVRTKILFLNHVSNFFFCAALGHTFLSIWFGVKILLLLKFSRTWKDTGSENRKKFKKSGSSGRWGNIVSDMYKHGQDVTSFIWFENMY